MNIRTFLTKYSILTIGIFLIGNPVYAVTPTPKATSSAVAEAEIEREKQITKELSLNMPDQTEDPNYPITFVDPGKFGVDITVDEKTTAKAPNPFLLPNLSIGEHKIIFKFKTKDGVVRVLTKKLLVTPKPPQFDQTLKTEVVRPNSVTIKGTALPQATIMIVINSDKTHKITSTTDGKWEFIVPEPIEGVNNILTFAIKNGIVSSASKTFSVIYKLNPSNVAAQTTDPLKENQVFAFARTIIANIDANRKERPTIFYGIIGVAVIAILVLIDSRLRKKAAKNRDDKTIAALFGTLQKDGGSIVEAIQSVAEKVTKRKKKPLAALKNEVASEDTIKPTLDVVAAALLQVEAASIRTVEAPVTPIEKVKSHSKIVVKSEPLVAVTDESEETEVEEPVKKVLTKVEFLKQFQKGFGQDE